MPRGAKAKQTEASGEEPQYEEPKEGRDDGGQGPSRLVVIGSSAGGVQALSTLVSGLPTDFRAPVVLAQHLDPLRPSSLAPILERRTSLPVVTVAEGIRLEPGRLYVTPANRNVVIRDGHIELQSDSLHRPLPSVDLLLTSASSTYGDRLVAVILTGSGSDGAAGAVEVKNAGGIVIIQNPLTAQYPSMPLALPPTAVDYVVDLEDIPRLLTDLVSDMVPSVPSSDNALQAILGATQQQANIDFRQYKPSTILRRIGRRMVMTRTPNLSDYADYIQQEPAEVGELVMAFLIKVTEFFRDPAAFTYLRKSVLPDLIQAGRERGNILRLWPAGCATGEEPYSLAMLVADMLGPELPKSTIRIFATDLDSEAITFARRGFYPENVLRNLPEDYRARFFEPAEHGYRIAKLLRQMVIYGQQDLAGGVPFPRIDLVLCRNLLIYFRPELQRRVLDKFAYALHLTHGILFLGQAETVRPAQADFEMVSKKWKIYRCVRSSEAGAVETSTGRQEATDAPWRYRARTPDSTGRPVPYAETAVTEPDVNQLRRFSERVLRSLPTGVVFIDRGYHIITINVAARRMLNIREPGMGQDFLHAARALPYNTLRSAVDEVFRDRTPVYLPEVPFDEPASSEPRYVSLSILAVDNEVMGAEAAMVALYDVTEVVTTRGSLEAAQNEQKQLLSDLQVTNRRLSDMNKNLQDANEQLQAANEELMLAHEELQATNEEFEATNEELQATNEELETNNEELQATNEELETTNEELSARTNELQELTRTLASERVRLSEMVELAPFYTLILRGPSLLVDASNVRYAAIFEGRKITGMPAEGVFPDPEEAQLMSAIRNSYHTDTAQHVHRVPKQVPDEHGGTVRRYFNYTVLPIHDNTSTVDGVAVYAEDVTEALVRAAGQQRENLKLMVEQADQVALGLFDARSMELLQASPRYLTLLARAHGYPEGTILGRKWQDLALNTAGDSAQAFFAEVVESRQGKRLSSVRVKGGSEEGETVWDFTVSPIALQEDGRNRVDYVAVSGIEVTDPVLAREELERVDRLKDVFLSSASHELRAPLVPLVGYADMLERIVREKQGEPGWDPRITEYASKFQGQLQHLKRLVDDLFDVARLESGRFTLDLEPVDLRSVLHGAIEEAKMQDESQQITFGSPGDVPITVMGDEHCLLQVFSNLLNNAIKYGGERKKIDVRLSERAVKGKKPQTVVEVQDYGVGIEPAEVARAFTSFYQSVGV